MSGTSEIVGRLYRIWNQKAEIESQLTRGPKQIAAARAQLEGATKALLEHRELIKSKKMDADRKQLQMREREAKLYDLEVKMNMSKNNREYQTLKEQIAADKQANSVLADEILEILEEIDRLVELTQGFVDREQRATDDTNQVESRIADAKVRLENDLKLVMAELTEAEKDLQGDLRSAYNRLTISMAEDAIAELEEASCGGCYTKLSPKLLDEMHMRKAILCTSCGRLVFSS